MRSCVVFASTSGSTRTVATLIAQACGPEPADLFDLARYEEWGERFDGRAYDLAFLGTPTYGTGDWHYRWACYASDVIGRLAPARPVALFALGDSRGHADSFAGGLARLYGVCRQSGFDCLGAIPADRFPFRRAPALVEGWFPGLVLDFRREHRAAPEIVSRWVASVAGKRDKLILDEREKEQAAKLAAEQVALPAAE